MAGVKWSSLPRPESRPGTRAALSTCGRAESKFLSLMAETFVLSFVEKLILLERTAGSDVHYRITPPISTPFYDSISVQKVARQIADSIGLSQFIFILTFVKQKKDVGGHIDLSTRGEEVFIEIDPDAIRFPNSVGATLCHEICHKWLQVMGISSPIEMDNEILTDITAVFLGFGKIMLNGCEIINVREERIAEGTQMTTETRTSGYLKRDQLAFAYRLVCAMRNVPRSEYMSGLSSDAANAIHACDRSYSHYYDERFHQPETTADAFTNLKTESVARQRQLADLNKHLDYVKQSFCETVENFLVAAHNTAEKLRQQSEAIVQETNHDPAWRFLRAIKKEHELEQMAQALAVVGSRANEFLAHSAVIGRHIWQNSSQFPAPSPTMFNIVRCPRDGTKLRLPQDSADLVVACPTCHYRFAYNTTCVSFAASTSKSARQKLSWTRRFWNFLRKR